MTSLRIPITAVWMLLIAATGYSFWLSAGDGDRVNAPAEIGILLIAFIKVRLIIMHFMEMRKSPALMRWISDAWTTFVCFVLIVLYITAPN